MEKLLAIVAICAFVYGFFLSSRNNPKDSAAGRWGIKTGKFLSGDWGGKEWGGKSRRKDD